MKHTFELYILTDNLESKYWEQLYKALLSQLGSFGKFKLIFTCKNNIVRYFIECDKDLGGLSNNIEGLLLQPTESLDLKLPSKINKERMVQFVAGGNILDLKEKVNVKRAKDLEIVFFDVRLINFEKAIVKTRLLFKDKAGSYYQSKKILTFLPYKLLAIDFANNTKYLKKSTPKYLDIEKALHIFVTDKMDALLEVDSFPYFSNQHYLNIANYEFDKHSFIIGASGSGKSKFISLLIDRINRQSLQRMNYRVVVIDPHASLPDDLKGISGQKVITFDQNDSTDLFPGAGTDLTAATELTSTLFKSILGEQHNARMDRLLRYSLFALLTAQTMTMDNLKKLLSDVEYRNQIIEHVRDYVPSNVVKFFGADYNELRTQFYNETILPIISMIDEMQLQPSLVNESDVSLGKTIQENFLTVFSLNKVSMGDKVVKTVAGLLIQQIFLLAQARVFGQKVILIIDEVSVVQNPALAQILAEARKFNLTVVLTQQYFGQIEKDLSDAIFANVFNYYCFKVSEEDARVLEGNLNINVPKEILEEQKSRGVKESEFKVKLMTELHPRECIVRVLAGGQVIPAFKARTVDAPIVKQVKEVDLQPVKQVLPEKFIEGQSGAKKNIEFSSNFLDKLMSQADHESYSDNIDDYNKMSKSLRDMLTAHSSSRKKLKKKE